MVRTNITTEEQKIIDDAWLNIEVDENKLASILDVPTEFAEDPNLWYTYIMSRPEYFHFITKHIFNLAGLSPMQLAILEEIWNRKFPMLIASRGFGKCVVGDTLIQTENAITTIEDLIGDTAQENIPVYNLGKVLNQYGIYNDIEYGWNNGYHKTKKIVTECGFELEGTHNHPIKVIRGSEAVWVNLEDVKTKDKVLIDKTKTWPKNTIDMTVEDAYELGTKLKDEPHTIFPSSILKTNKRAAAYFIKGIMDSKGKYYHLHYTFKLELLSEKFIKTLQFILTRFGIISTLSKCKDKFVLTTFGKDSLVFKAEIGHQEMKPIFKINPKYFIKPYVFDTVVKIEDGFKKTYDVHCKDEHSFISNAFISHNTYLMGIYCLLRLMLMPGRKIVVAGAGFRQSKLVFDYMEQVWKNSPLLRDIYRGVDNGPKHSVDEWTFTLGKSVLRAIPIGNGEKIRGLRANDLFVDEFASINREIFETVLAGFGAVAANPMDNVKLIASKKKAQEMNIKFLDADIDKPVKPNQIVISGTASYDFEHFAEYWRRWHDYICSKGDYKKLNKYSIDKNFDWKDYSIIRVPFELIPEGFMDASNVARARASSHTSVYLREYGACFPKDSMGFFKRTVIDAATIKPTYEPNSMPSDVSLFYPIIKGKQENRYVLACDPASDVDNLSIVLLQVEKLHNRIVYCWTTNKKAHLERLQKGLTTENNYYAYCARKIRDLYKDFKIEYIIIDSQGGGKHIIDAMNDKDKMFDDENFLWPIIEENKEKPTDNFAGQHNVIFINFADAEWTSSANHGLRKDLEDKTLIFPFFDPVFLAELALQDNDGNPLYDTVEDCVFEIEELKNELCTIVQTKTPNGRDKWDTPEIKTNTGKKGRMRKDRYSALLMANSVARELQLKFVETKKYFFYAGIAGQGEDYKTNKYEKPYNAPEWFKSDW